MAISLQPGSVVTLKTGGPEMTVVDEGHEPGRVRCEWFERNEHMSGEFAEASLKRIDDDEDGGSFNAMGR